MYKFFSFKIMSQPGKNLIYPKQFSNIFKCNKKNNKKIKPHNNHEKRNKKRRKEYNN